MRNFVLLGCCFALSMILLPSCKKSQRYTRLENERVRSESGGQNSAGHGEHGENADGLVVDSESQAQAIRDATVNGATANIDVLPPADPDDNKPKPTYNYPDSSGGKQEEKQKAKKEPASKPSTASTFPRPPLTNETHHLYGEHEKVQDMVGNWVLRTANMPVPSVTVKRKTKPQTYTPPEPRSSTDYTPSEYYSSGYTEDGEIPDVPE